MLKIPLPEFHKRLFNKNFNPEDVSDLTCPHDLHQSILWELRLKNKHSGHVQDDCTIRERFKGKWLYSI